MSLFGKLFGGGGGKGGKGPTPQEAIQKLRETEDMLAKKQDFLEKKIDMELVTAKKNGTKNKRECVRTLFNSINNVLLDLNKTKDESKATRGKLVFCSLENVLQSALKHVDHL
ncbi:Charged multivesicular body protein 4b [Liparis tanakae]|uniref:Charged multivesicular body protein 4b n=1 Tax=Liparis tanakae TaxID=230148 RepID=A0A4Z2EHA9_9TELE|nr:Charged multivesicular body protein 4b [Liparis tanakae]